MIGTVSIAVFSKHEFIKHVQKAGNCSGKEDDWRKADVWREDRATVGGK